VSGVNEALNLVYVSPQLAYASDGRYYVSCSSDGSIKVWDGSSSRCVNTFAGAHGGAEVCACGWGLCGVCVYILEALVVLSVITTKKKRLLNGLDSTTLIK
jgi:WD40 repeat protein